MGSKDDPSFIARHRPHRSPAMTPVLIRPARAADAADLADLAALDSAAPLTGEVLLAKHSGGEIAAAMSLDTGAVIADPFVPTANLVELLRTAARPAPRRRGRLAALPLRPLRAA
jgi:hypothetical protein